MLPQMPQISGCKLAEAMACPPFGDMSGGALRQAAQNNDDLIREELDRTWHDRTRADRLAAELALERRGVAELLREIAALCVALRDACGIASALQLQLAHQQNPALASTGA